MELTEQEREHFLNDLLINFNTIEWAIEVSVKSFDVLKELKNDTYDNFLNTALFSLLIQADLILLVENYNLSSRKYEKSLIARLIALTIVEYLDDISHLIGKVLKEFEVNGLLQFKEVFKSINKEYSQIRKENQSLLKEIRNNSIAHKVKNSFQLAKIISEIDSEKIYLLSFEMIRLSTKLSNANGDIMEMLFNDLNQNSS